MQFLDNALNLLTLSFMRGYNNLSGWINGLLALIFLIDLLFLAIKWMLGMKDIKETANKVLNYGIWFLAVLIFPYFMNHVQRMFTSIGITAGTSASATAHQSLYFGNAPGAAPVTDTGRVPTPASILAQGIRNAQPLLDAGNNTSVFDLGARLFYLICWILMMISYVIMTVQFLVTYLEFSVLIGIGGIFMPFGLMQETRFLSEKFLGAATGHGIKIMLLNFIFSVGNLVLANISEIMKNNLKPDTILTAITVSVLFMILAQNVPAMAVGILSGTPALNDAHLANTLRTVGAAAGAVRAATQLAGFAGRGGLQGLVGMGGGMAKAIGAGNNAADNFIQNVDAAGYTAPAGGTIKAWSGGAAKSLVGSLGSSAFSAASRGFNRMMWGKDAKWMQQMQKPDSLRTMGTARSYIANRFNQGKSGDIGNIAQTGGFKNATKKPYIPPFVEKPHTPGPTATEHYTSPVLRLPSPVIQLPAPNMPDAAPSDHDEEVNA